jgi:hypothetical protein
MFSCPTYLAASRLFASVPPCFVSRSVAKPIERHADHADCGSRLQAACYLTCARMIAATLKRGPGWVVLAGTTVTAIGMGTFAYGVSHHCAYRPVLLTGLALMGMGAGSTMMPLFGCAVRGLAPHQVACGSTLINVNLQVAGSIGTALMSVILTSQFNHSQFIQAAGKAAA